MTRHEPFDVVLIGAGIMSTTLATLLTELGPNLSLLILERLDGPAQESSDGWNNAGTGHAANCEMNYTPERADGGIELAKALEINVQFDISRQLWSHLVTSGAIPDPGRFIQPCPHLSFVTGADNVAFLKKRHAAMAGTHNWRGMEYTEDPAVLAGWAPLLMAGRDASEPIAATRMATGSDVDYGTLTRILVDHLADRPDVTIRYSTDVHDLTQDADGCWRIAIRPHQSKGEQAEVRARRVFVGAGGGSLPLLQKSGISEGRGYGGFPVSGIWLRCDNPDVVRRHTVKVYGKAAHGSPPMSVPHLDMRVVNDQRSILFGPYAGFSPNFLKEGSYLDLFKSIRLSNLEPLIDVAVHNFQLEEYLADQVVLSHKGRFETLKAFYPDADPNDWRETTAGQRVEVIKPDDNGGGVLELGTELIVSADKSLLVLMGASPGASTAAAIALDVLRKGFRDRLVEEAWLPKLRNIIPTYGIDLSADADACLRSRRATAAVLGLEQI